jgi:hypothetical protein
MPPPGSEPQLPASGALRERLASLGRAVGAREAEHKIALDEAFREARRLHGLVSDALKALHTALAEQGCQHLRVHLGEPRLDEKHIRAVQFELERGRTVALVTVKSRGDVTLVGPFRSGKTEGPCQSVPWTDPRAVEEALAGFLERFLELAIAP